MYQFVVFVGIVVLTWIVRLVVCGIAGAYAGALEAANEARGYVMRRGDYIASGVSVGFIFGIAYMYIIAWWFGWLK